MNEVEELRAEIADVKGQLFVLMKLLPVRINQSDINKAYAEFKVEPTYSGKPCKYGHSIKYTKGSHCVECSNIRNKALRDMEPTIIPKMSAATAHTLAWR